jgi:hypothetical protein
LETGADGFVAVTAVGGGVERQFDNPVMRQINGAPTGVAEIAGGWTAALAGFVQPFAGCPIIAQAEFPAKIQQQPFARRVCGQGNQTCQQPCGQRQSVTGKPRTRNGGTRLPDRFAHWRVGLLVNVRSTHNWMRNP